MFDKKEKDKMMMSIMIALLVVFHIVPAEVSTFQMEYPKGHVVTYTRKDAATWDAKGPDPEVDNGVYKVDRDKLIQKEPDQMTITPDVGWGLKPDTKWSELTTIKRGAEDRIGITKTATSVVFTIKEGSGEPTKATVTWKLAKTK